MKKNRQALDTYRAPSAMLNYLENYGHHFNRHLYEFAVARMHSYDRDGKETEFVPWTRDEIAELMTTQGLYSPDDAYDGAYLANLCKAKHLGRSMASAANVALFVRTTLDDPDMADGTIFRQWLATMVSAGVPIMWDDML